MFDSPLGEFGNLFWDGLCRLAPVEGAALVLSSVEWVVPSGGVRVVPILDRRQECQCGFLKGFWDGGLFVPHTFELGVPYDFSAFLLVWLLHVEVRLGLGVGVSFWHFSELWLGVGRLTLIGVRCVFTENLIIFSKNYTGVHPLGIFFFFKSLK